MNNNAPNSDDPYRDRHSSNTGGERRSGQPGGGHGNGRDGSHESGDRGQRDRFEDSLAETWDAPDASVDRRLRAMVGPVTPLYPPPYGYERVVLRARRRRHRTAFIAAAASVVAVAVVAGGVVAGTHLSGGTVNVAGCDSVGQSTPGAANGIDQPVNIAEVADVVGIADARGGPSGIGAGRGVMDRKYEWAIGGVLTAAALSVGIVAGCSSSANNKGPSASGTLSGAPTSPGQSSAGAVTLPAPSASGSATASAGASGVAGVPRCHTADLSPAVNIVNGSQGAGSESMNIVLTNQSGHTCTVYGYPGMKLEDTNLSGQATTVTRNHGLTPATLTVANGGSVATTARFDFDVPAKDEPQTGNCEAPSVYLEITPPDETTQLSATITGGPVTVCQHGTIDVLPFVAGSTGPNQ